MIHRVTGDILLSRAQAIAHGIAANDPMNQGLALALHQRYPTMHRDFHHWCHVSHPKPGEIWTWAGPGGVRVVNLITQEGGYGHGARPGKATVSHVRHVLKALRKLAEAEGFAGLALPKVATGVGGLSWDDVAPLIEDELGDIALPVYLYETYRPGIAAEEPALPGAQAR